MKTGIQWRLKRWTERINARLAGRVPGLLQCSGLSYVGMTFLKAEVKGAVRPQTVIKQMKTAIWGRKTERRIFFTFYLDNSSSSILVSEIHICIWTAEKYMIIFMLYLQSCIFIPPDIPDWLVTMRAVQLNIGHPKWWIKEEKLPWLQRSKEEWGNNAKQEISGRSISMVGDAGARVCWQKRWSQLCCRE